MIKELVPYERMQEIQRVMLQLPAGGSWQNSFSFSSQESVHRAPCTERVRKKDASTGKYSTTYCSTTLSSSERVLLIERRQARERCQPLRARVNDGGS